MKYGILAAVGLLALAACSAGKEEAEAPLPVILDTDMGNDVDDLLAMQMLMNYESEGRVKVLGIGLAKANRKACDFVRAYYGRYGSGAPTFGYMTSGSNPDDGNYLTAALAALGTDSLPAGGCESVEMYRRLLSSSADSSLTIIAIGPLTNMARLLDSAPDSISPLSGEELVGRKVRSLCMMGGDFRSDAAAEWNILQDSVAARVVFDRWPTELVTSGSEVGNAVLYPHQSILGDYAPEHPLRVAYENFIPMPYDRQCWDLTTVLYAVEPDSTWFELSPRGEISVDTLGRTGFEQAEQGRRRVLALACDSLANVLVNRVNGK